MAVIQYKKRAVKLNFDTCHPHQTSGNRSYPYVILKLKLTAISNFLFGQKQHTVFLKGSVTISMVMFQLPEK